MLRCSNQFLFRLPIVSRIDVNHLLDRLGNTTGQGKMRLFIAAWVCPCTGRTGCFGRGIILLTFFYMPLHLQATQVILTLEISRPVQHIHMSKMDVANSLPPRGT